MKAFALKEGNTCLYEGDSGQLQFFKTRQEANKRLASVDLEVHPNVEVVIVDIKVVSE